MRTSLSSLAVAVIALTAACNRDSTLTAPLGPATPQTAALSPAFRLVAIDSAALPFAGTAAERAAGHYAFQVVDTAPALAPGDYVVAQQGGRFLGRVDALSRSGNRLTLELAPAAWHDVYQPLKIRIPFTPGAGSAPSPYGTVRWGPWRQASRRGLGPQAARLAAPLRTSAGTVIDPTDFNPLDFLLSSPVDLCAQVSIGVVTGCSSITAKLIAAHFSLTGGVDVSINLDIPHASLAASATVNQQLATDADFQLTGNGSVEVDVPIPDAGFARDFTVGPYSGKIEVGIIVGVTGSVTGTTIEPHVAIADTASSGASVSTSTGKFDFNFSGVGHFDAGAKVVDLGTLGVKLAVGPKAEVSLDLGAGGGFDLGAGADGFAEATENLAGLFGLENWHVHVDVGTEGVVDGTVKVPLINVGINASHTFPGPGVNLLDLWGTGDLNVASSTTGSDIFPGQIYTTSVARTNPNDPPPWFAVLSSQLGVNDSHLFHGGVLCRQFFQGAPLIPPFIEAPQDCDLVATAHSVNLTGWAWNCSAAEALPAPVQVRPRNPFNTSRLTSLTLGVVCRSAYAIVRDFVATLLATGAINRGGIATALDAKLNAAEMARLAGDPAGADSALVALANQLRAQNGKHITTAADAQLQAFDALLRACYETIVPTCSMVPAATSLAVRSGGL